MGSGPTFLNDNNYALNMADGYRMTLRQLYYQMIALDRFPNSWIDEDYNWRQGLPANTKNTIKNYSRLSKLISDARLAGLVDWDGIVDNGRTPRKASEWETLADLVDSALAAFRLPRWADQDNYVELWVEKDALASVLWPIANRYHITLMVNKGYSSQSAMYTSSQRFIDAFDSGKAITLLYLGDHDPSGEDMVRDIDERMRMFEVVDLDVRKIALTMAQIRRYNPPPNPAKVTDPRAARYIEQFGNQSWEVDALSPAQLTQLIEGELDQLRDRERWDIIVKREEELKTRLRKAAAKIE